MELEEVVEQSVDGEDGRQEVKATFALLPTLPPPHPLLQSIPENTQTITVPRQGLVPSRRRWLLGQQEVKAAALLLGDVLHNDSLSKAQRARRSSDRRWKCGENVLSTYYHGSRGGASPTAFVYSFWNNLVF